MLGQTTTAARSIMSRSISRTRKLTANSSRNVTTARTPNNGRSRRDIHQRAISAPPTLRGQQWNAFTQLPPPLVADSTDSSVYIGRPIPLRADEAPTPRDAIIVYTDGSCKGNYASGVGIYFGDSHPLNLSQALPGPLHTSVLAEIQAALIALERLHKWPKYNGQKVILRSDCKAIVDKLKSGDTENYGSEMARLRLAAQRFANGVEFQHVYGHNGQKGNEEADRLAGLATAERGRARSVSVNRHRSRSRSASRNGRGAPNSTVFVPPKPESASLVIPPPSQSQRSLKPNLDN